MSAAIPQPGPGEPLSDRCCWCGAERRGSRDDRIDHQWRDYECKASGAESTSEARPSWWDVMHPFPNADRLCTRTPAEVAAVVTDMVTEREHAREIMRDETVTTVDADGSVLDIGHEIGAWRETPDAVLRRVLLASFDPETETERTVAALLADTRQEPVRA